MEYSVVILKGVITVIPSFAVQEGDEVIATGTYQECKEFIGKGEKKS
jgi:hypothetical protein